jgi:integrase
MNLKERQMTPYDSPAVTDDVSVAGEQPALPPAATLADVQARLQANPSRERRHVEMKSAIRKMGEALHRPLIDIPADPAQLRGLIAAASRASIGMSKARWSRVRSLTLAALRDLGIDMMPGRDIGGISPAWKALADQLPTKALRIGLSRFMSNCARRGIEPCDVSSATFEEFDVFIKGKSLWQKPDVIYRGTVRRWNAAAEAVPGWPQTPIPLAAHAHFYSLGWTEFPASFTADVEAFLFHAANQDELCELDEDYVSSVKQSTVNLRRRQLRQLASVLVASGFPIEKLTSLAGLTEPENAKSALRYQRGRQGGETTVSLVQMAWLLCTVARHWVKDRDHAEALRVIAGRYKLKPKGMTDRNRSRLRQFDHKPNQDALLHLPATVMSQAKRKPVGTPAEARRYMLALAVELLIIAPMRVGNLTGLEPARHILELGRGRQRTRHIYIPKSETKTDTAFEVKLPDSCCALLDEYLKTYRARVCPTSSPYLFPSSGGGRRNTIAFSKAITGFVEKETGIKMHAHLFRQLAGKFYLDAHPTDIETVRQILGHRSTATTARYYVEQRQAQAFGRYDETLADLRGTSGRIHRVAHRQSNGLSQ